MVGGEGDESMDWIRMVIKVDRSADDAKSTFKVESKCPTEPAQHQAIWQEHNCHQH